MPVIAICSQKRHRSTSESNHTSSVQQTKHYIDLHTIEAPIVIRDDDITVDEMHLHDLVVDGILNIYAVERECSQSRGDDRFGMDEIFAADDHWVSLTIAF